MAIDIGLGVAVPDHEAAKFTRKQDSLHALVGKWERSKQSLPYLLATQFCAGTVFGEDGKGVGAVVPQCLKSAIEQGFENVTVVRVQSHPGVLLLVVHNAFGCGDERAAKADAGQHPSELETEDVEKEVDVARKIFVPVHAALAESVVSGEVCFLPDAAAFFRVAAASGASTSSGRRAGGAMASAAAEPTTCSATRSLKRAGVAVLSAAVKTARAFAAIKVARAFAGEGRAHSASAVDRGNLAGLVVARAGHGRARWARMRATSTQLFAGHAAQNKLKVSVHQGSLILKSSSAV
jgi:hypothetical protein